MHSNPLLSTKQFVRQHNQLNSRKVRRSSSIVTDCTDYHHEYVRYLNQRNHTDFSAIHPSNGLGSLNSIINDDLITINDNDGTIQNGRILTPAITGDSCNIDRMRVGVTSTSSMRERVLCKFDYVLNYNPKVCTIIYCIKYIYSNES